MELGVLLVVLAVLWWAVAFMPWRCIVRSSGGHRCQLHRWHRGLHHRAHGAEAPHVFLR